MQGNLSGKQDKLPVLSEKREFLQDEIPAMLQLPLDNNIISVIIVSIVDIIIGLEVVPWLKNFPP